MEEHIAGFPHAPAFCTLRVILKPGTYGSP